MNTRHHYLSLLRTFALATLTAAAVTACTDDNGDPTGSEPIVPADGIPVAFTANINPGSDANPDTRTILTPTDNGGFTITWKGTDNNPTSGYDLIQIWAAMGNTLANSGSPKYYVPTTSEASSELEPGDGSQLTLTSTGKWNFTAIYGTNSTTKGTAPASISPLTQSAPGKTEHIAAKDFSVATAEQHIEGNSEMPAIISFKFKHMLSALQLQVKNGTGEALTVNEIRLSVTGEKITTEKYYGVIAKGWIDDGKRESDYLQLKITNPAALANDGTVQKFHMLLFPGYENKTLTITVITDHGEYTLTKGAPTGGFLAGKNYLTDITIKSNPGTGETWSEYVDISTADELKTFRDNVNNGTNYAGKIVRLKSHINLANAKWTPIGTDASKSFSGTFDGGGYLISYLNVDNGSNEYAGLFGYVDGGTVRNLLVSGKVKTTGNYAGGIAGRLYRSTVENCIFSGNVSGGIMVGGIAGSDENSLIAGCYTNGSVTATNFTAGGIAGENHSSSIENCYSKAEVKASHNIGGIVGKNRGGTITHCYATGAMSAGMNVGGIVGSNSEADIVEGIVTGCIALNPSLTRTSGNATNFGRVVGANNSCTVDNCAAFKDMTIKDATSNATIIGDDLSVAGDDLTAADCLTETTYTSRGFTEATATTPGWAFDYRTTWTYLPWNQAFKSFHNISETDYRISVPQHITDVLIP